MKLYIVPRVISILFIVHCREASGRRDASRCPHEKIKDRPLRNYFMTLFVSLVPRVRKSLRVSKSSTRLASKERVDRVSMKLVTRDYLYTLWKYLRNLCNSLCNIAHPSFYFIEHVCPRGKLSCAKHCVYMLQRVSSSVLKWSIYHIEKMYVYKKEHTTITYYIIWSIADLHMIIHRMGVIGHFHSSNVKFIIQWCKLTWIECMVRLHHVLINEFSESFDQVSNFNPRDLEDLCSCCCAISAFTSRGLIGVLGKYWKSNDTKPGKIARACAPDQDFAEEIFAPAWLKDHAARSAEGEGLGESARDREHIKEENCHATMHMCATTTTMTDFAKMTADLETRCAALPGISNRRPAWRESVRVRHAGDEVGSLFAK